MEVTILKVYRVLALLQSFVKFIYNDWKALFELLCWAVAVYLEAEVLAVQQVNRGLLVLVAESAFALLVQAVSVQVAPEWSSLVSLVMFIVLKYGPKFSARSLSRSVDLFSSAFSSFFWSPGPCRPSAFWSLFRCPARWCSWFRVANF